MPTPATIQQSTLVELTRAGSVRSIQAVESGNGRYAVVAKVGMEDRTLASQRDSVRQFADLGRLAKYLKDTLGVKKFEVIGQ